MATTLFPAFTSIPTVTSTTTAGVSHIDLAFASAMSKGVGSIFVTDGVVQTVIDRATGLPKLRVVGATVTKEIPLDQVSISGNHVSFDAAGLTPGISWNVYMGAGTLLSGERPYAGLSAPGQAVFSTPAAVEPPPPPPPLALGATIELDGSSLKSGEDIFVTISFTRAVTQLDPALLTAGNASVSGLATHDEGKTWHATLTGKAATDAPGSTLRLDLGAVVAADGTRGAGVVDSAPYAVDTLVAAYVGASIEMVDDMGPYRDDGVSNDDTMDVRGLLYGALAEGDVFELVINGRSIDADTIEFFPTGDPGILSWTYSSSSELGPDDANAVAERFIHGENKVEARVKGANGHSSPAASKTILVETDAPDIVAAPTGLVDAGKAIAITFNEKMYWDDKVEVSHDLKVVDSFGNTSWIDLSAGQLSLDRMTLSFDPAEHELATGNTYRFYLPEGLTDLAGNAYAGPAIAFTTAGTFQDKAAPRLLQAYIVDGNGLYGKGDTLEFRLRYSEQVTLEAGATPLLDLNNGALARYAGLTADGKEMRFTYTVAAGDDTSLLDVSRPWSLAGDVRDAAGNVMQSAHIEFDGLSTADGHGAAVALDTVVATPDAPRLHAGSDSGTAGDFITLDTTPRLDGSGAEAGATVSLYEDKVLLGTATADSDGHWNLVPTAPLGAGAHRLHAIQQDVAGNLSELSAGLDITILALPATLAAPVLQAASDTGVSASDRVTSDNTPTISGKAAANATLTVLHNGASKASVTADGNGDWSYTPALLPDGAHSFTVRYADVAGHAGVASSALSLTVDTNKPNVTGSPDGATAFAIGADIVITFDEALHWNDREQEDGLLVLQDGLGVRRSIRIDASDFSGDGRKLILRAADHELLASTSYKLLLPSTLTDLAGNRLDEYEIDFHTAAPGAYAGPSVNRVSVNIGDHTARAGETVIFGLRFDRDVMMTDDAIPSLGLSNGKQAQFTGFSADGKEMLFRYIVQPGDDTEALSITDTSELTGHVADLAGSLLDAAYIELGDLVDNAGDGTWLEIDTIAPEQPALPELDHDSNSGSVDDLLTSDRTPTLEGRAQAGTRIELYEDGTLLGAGYADDDGEWEVSVELAHALADGLHRLAVKHVDAAGNSSEASNPLALTIDGAVAALSGLALADGFDTGSSLTDGLTKSTRPDLKGVGAEAGATIRILAGSTVVGGGTALPDGSWTADLDIVLPDGAYAYTAQQVDKAGNVSTLSAPLAFAVDATGPAVLARPLLAAPSDSGALDTDGITNDTTPAFTGSGAEAGATVVLMAGTRELGRATVNATGHWSVEVGAANALADDAYGVTAYQIDKAGNTGAASSAFSLVVDTVAAGKPALPQLDLGSNSGSVNDLLTNDYTPTLTGVAEAGARIGIYEGSTLLGSARANEEGAWEAGVELAHALADGLHKLTVKQVDAAGNTSEASSPLTITIDTAIASLSALALGSGFDTGISLTDGLSSFARPDLKGAGAEAGAAIRILAGDTVVGRGSALPDGSWTAALDSVLPDGAYTYTAQQIDAAGNASAPSAPLAFTIDTTAPSVLAAPLLAALSDSGILDNDGITNDSTPLFTGSGAEAGATVVLMAGTRELGRGTVGATGNWSVEVSAANALASATHAVSVHQIDKAGNTGAASSPFNLVIDTVAPTVLGSGRDLLAREFKLMFSEEIFFHPSGRFDLKESAAIRASFVNNSGNWYRSDGAGGEDSVLNFKLSLTGLYKLVMNNDAIVDVAGNVAVIGQPNWEIDLPLLSILS